MQFLCTSSQLSNTPPKKYLLYPLVSRRSLDCHMLALSAMPFILFCVQLFEIMRSFNDYLDSIGLTTGDYEKAIDMVNVLGCHVHREHGRTPAQVTGMYRTVNN